MAENKTKQTRASVSRFLAAVKDPQQRKDSRRLAALMRAVTRKKPVMWGPAIVGFGSVHYRYESGREGDMPVLAFSPRKGSLVIYGTSSAWKDIGIMGRLGRYKTGKGCLYIKRLDEAHLPALRQLLRQANGKSR